MALNPRFLHYYGFDEYVDQRSTDDRATHVAWPLDDLPGLAAAIHATVLDLVVHGSSGPDVDTAILDCLRGTTPRAGDDPGAVHP